MLSGVGPRLFSSWSYPRDATTLVGEVAGETCSRALGATSYYVEDQSQPKDDPSKIWIPLL